MVIDQNLGECLCVSPQFDGDADEWQISHGEVDDAGTVVMTETILQLPRYREIVVLAKKIGDDLDIPVYEILPNGEPELIQAPILDK